MDTLWTRVFGDVGDDEAHQVIETTDNGIFVIGWSDSYLGGLYGNFMVKVDENGNSADCNSASTNTSVGNPTVTVGNGAIQLAEVMVEVNAFYQVSTPSLYDSLMCSTLTSVPKYRAPENVMAYPNPTAGPLRIELGAANEDLTVSVFSYNGQLIERHQMSGSHTLDLSLEHLPAGIYMVHVFGPEESLGLKILKE